MECLRSFSTHNLTTGLSTNRRHVLQVHPQARVPTLVLLHPNTHSYRLSALPPRRHCGLRFGTCAALIHSPHYGGDPSATSTRDPTLYAPGAYRQTEPHIQLNTQNLGWHPTEAGKHGCVVKRMLPLRWYCSRHWSDKKGRTYDVSRLRRVVRKGIEAFGEGWEDDPCLPWETVCDLCRRELLSVDSPWERTLR